MASIDGWANFMTPGTINQTGTVQVILAIGTEEQIANLRESKKRMGLFRSFLRDPQPNLPIASRSAFPPLEKLPAIGVSSQTTATPSDVNTRKAQMAARLTSFIENLASELPDQARSKVNPVAGTGAGLGNYMNLNLKTTNMKQDISAVSPPPGKNIRATADLLDELQRALTSASTMRRNTTAPCGGGDDGPKTERFGVIIDIDSATNLPKQIIKLNKKHSKRRDINSHNLSGDGRQRENTINEIEPSSYVTFEATGPTINMVSTVDGPVYTTNVVLKNCNPRWNKRFDVYLPVEYLFNVSEKFRVCLVDRVDNILLQLYLCFYTEQKKVPD